MEQRSDLRIKWKHKKLKRKQAFNWRIQKINMKIITTIIAAAAVFTVAANAEPAEYGSRKSLNKQVALYEQVYNEEGDAWVSGDLETHYACQRLLYKINLLASEEHGAKWAAARDRATKRIDAFHAAHPE